jgi:hypothetical protein
MHLAQLAVDPDLALLLDRAQRFFQPHQDGGVEHAIGQRFPAFDGRAFAALRRNQLADRRERIQVFDDNAGVEHCGAVFHDQARHLAQGIGLRNDGFRAPDVIQYQLVIELFFSHDDAHFTHIRTGEGTE